MKKIYTFALIFFTFLSCIVFSACGDKYADLQMRFYSASGNAIESINLIIDSNNDELQSTTIGVRFSGIDSSDIGDVKIYSNPSELITVSNARLQNDTYYVDISANNMSGSGKLVVLHGASDKTYSIDLTISRKSNNIITSADTYIISIPESGDREVFINSKDVVTLLPSGSTDNVYFKVKDDSFVQDVNFKYVSANSDNFLIEGFVVGENVPVGAELTLYPVTYMNGYELTEYPNNEITFKFIRTLSSDMVYLSTDEYHQEYLNSNETIYLISKDLGVVTTPDNKQYNFNNIQLMLQYLQGEDYVDLDAGEINYYDFYEIDMQTTDENISTYNAGNNLVVQAVDYTETEVEVTIRLVPKNCVGDISVIEKTLKVKGEVKPSDIEVEMQGEPVDINYSIDLYDYYVSGGSALGALFNFNPIVEYSYSDLKGMRISIQPEILNAYLSQNGDFVGVNRIYTDDTFSTLITSNENTGYAYRDNKYVLELYLYNQPLKFYYDTELSLLVSEPFSNVDNLYIKYVETDNENDDYTLNINAFTYYSGEYLYLQEIENTTINLTFNRLEGVRNLEVNAGYLSQAQADGSYRETIYTDNNAQAYVVNNVYLNRLEGTDNSDIHAYILYVGPGNVLGERDRELTNADFEVSVQGGKDNPLTLKQYSINDGNGKDNGNNVIVGGSTINYTFDSNNGVANAILFVFNRNTDIGEYKITFSHANGYSLTINCYLYQRLSTSDINYEFEENDKAFRNSNYISDGDITNISYLYPDYTADYIVAAGQTLNLQVLLDDYFLDTSYVIGYDFTAEFNDTTIELVSNYLRLENFNNSTDITFVKGTYFNDRNYYINLNIIVRVQNYSDIITPNGYIEIPITRSFFIYEEIGYDEIEINYNSVDRYMLEYLGAYYLDQASVNLEVSILGEDRQYLWNYVQAYNQEEDYNIGITSNETVDGETGETHVDNQYKVVWYTENNDFITTDDQGDKNIELTFSRGQDEYTTSYYRDIYAQVKQFNTTYTFRSRVTVHKPIITQTITVESEVNFTADSRQEYYIDLKAGEEYQVVAENSSTEGNVTNDDIFMVMVDNQGNQNYNFVTLDNNTYTLTVREGELSSNANLKLIIFAKDALNQNISQSTAGFDDISSFLMNGSDENPNAYKNAYIVINIYLSDGSQSNPYIINDANDFWEINSDTDAHYRLMNNIDISNTSYTGEKVITDFSGTIVTYQDNNNISYTYTLYGISLDNDNYNLFKNFSGSISNVNFNVDYAYDITVGADTYLGVFDINKGALTNVSVVFNGNASINQENATAPMIYFGSLVGENRGEISYTSNVIVGGLGDIRLSGNANVYYGGLVGRNLAKIEGYNNSVSTNNLNTNYSLLNSNRRENSEIIFSVYIANEGAMADVNIRSNMTNSNSAIGGIIGINDYESDGAGNQSVGTLSNAFVTGTITGLNNIGGAIGINRTPKLNMTVTIGNGQIIDIKQTANTSGESRNDVYYVQNVKSNIVISGGDFVGGIVGSDDGGSYKEVHYQILSSTGTGITANSRVGGIAGSSNNGIFIYCSVMSYRWDYNALRSNGNYNDTFNSTPDIVGSNYVAGIVGYATNEGNTSFNDGANELETVIVQLSSVNAYILADTGTALISDAGAILANGQSTNMSIVYNAYFIGKIEGAVFYETSTDQTNRLPLANNTNVVFNDVYTVVVDNEELVIGNYADGYGQMLIGSDNDNMENWNDSTYWAYNEEINGGYIYLLNENGECLFEIAPTSLSAIIKDEYKLAYNDVELDSIIHLDFYEFNLDTTDENYTLLYNALNERYNTYDLLDLFDFEYEPTSLSQIRIYAETSNSSIIYINNSEIIVRGVGQCTITFISILNTSIRASITFDVSYATGDNLIISDSALSSNDIDNVEQNIAYNKAKQYYIMSTGTVDYNNEQYQYLANEDIYLRVEVGIVGDLDTDYSYTQIPDYISVSGVVGDVDDVNEKIIYIIDSNTPFSISVLNYLLDGHLSFTITPYTIIRYQDSTLGNIEIDRVLSNAITTFDLYTRQGASKISLNYDSVTLYPNDNTTITAFITTDIELTEQDLATDLSYSHMFYDIETGLNLTDVNLTANIELIRNEGLNTDTGLQTVYYRLTIDETTPTTSNNPIGLRLTYTLLNGENASINFTILPQRINKIEIKNYVYSSEDGSITQSNVLRPTGEGLIILDIAPSNGYYDYLEISDVTGREEIIFAQIDGVNGSRLSEMDRPSSDGTGIRLIKDYDGFNGSLYIATMISNTYSSMVHTIKVTAFLNSGEQIGSSFYYEIDVKMLPGIQVDYLKPNGETVISYTDTSSNIGTIYVANNVDTRFRISTTNSDGNVDISLDSTNFEMVEEYNGYYSLRFTNPSANLIGETSSITFTTRATLENGDYEEASVEIQIQIVEFVIHDISVTHSRTNSSGDTEIYGDYGVNVELEFYFDDTDISYYNGNSFWDRVYRYDESITESSGATYYINEILKALNTDRSADNNTRNKYLSLSNYDLDDDNEMKDISLYGNTLRVEAGNLGAILNLDFLLKLNADNYWEITSQDEIITTNISNMRSGDVISEYSYNYYLNFINSNSYEEPEVITSEEEFLTMQSGEDVHYILARDLVFDNYIPIDVNVKTFDGNGHTITIRSFDLFDDEVIYAGLFEQIYEGMIVMNLNVEYQTVNNGTGSYSFGQVRPSTSSFSINYADICNNPEINYSAAYFGAITPVNNGIITNCKSSGYVALHASTIESKTSSYNIEFYMGGLVAQNASTGYITNSTSALSMFALANMGGLAYSNEGKIVSSAFDAQTPIFTYEGDSAIYSGGGFIYAYNNSVVNTSLVSVAGFVVNNSGEISMSYVHSGSTELQSTTSVRNTIGNISAKDISAGFVYSNTNSIYDCYVNLTKIGANNNRFSGFANGNSGSISRCYTYINEGNRNSSEVNMFAPTNTTGISDSYEIMIIPDGYNNRIEGLTTIRTSLMTQESSYPAFTFGDNESAVWYLDSGMTPRLVISNEKVEYTANQTPSDDMYYGLRNIRIIKETITDDDGHTTVITNYETINGTYGSKENPYLIYDLNTWDFYFSDETTHYYRLISDIDFSSINGNPTTSEYTFKGNIQGNNMDISGLMIYSGSSLNSIGLFKDMVGADDISIKNSVRNLDINVKSILATKTTAVGSLAGIIEDFNVYNIDIDADGVIVVGANAVGGLAGIVRGNINVENITSNIGVNSTRASSGYRYSIYLSRNNGQEISYNLTNVYYAGSIIGIVDGYQNANYDINNSRDIVNSTYFDVKDINVSGNITAIGDTVGGAFGLIGERIRVSDVNIDINNGSLSGAQYSALVAGENRGLILDSNIISESDTLFNSSNNVSAGLVGLNLGGYIDNVNVNANIVKTDTNNTVAGIIGRNVNGYIRNSYYNGNLLGYITGGIIGANYDRETLINRTSGAGAIETDGHQAVPANTLTYRENGSEITDKISNVSVGVDSLNYWFNNMRSFYTYLNEQNSFDEAVRASRVLGLMIGVSNSNNMVYQISLDENEMTFNGDINDSYMGLVDTALLYTGNEEYDIMYSNIIDLDNTQYDCTYITYILGANVSTFDAWDRETYSDSRLVLTPETDKINRLDFVVVNGDDSTTLRNYYINADRLNSSVNENKYVFSLTKHTENTIVGTSSFNLYYEFILKYFDEDTDLNIEIISTNDDDEENTETSNLTAEEIAALVSRNEAFITFAENRSIQVKFTGKVNGESVIYTYIFNKLN